MIIYRRVSQNPALLDPGQKKSVQNVVMQTHAIKNHLIIYDVVRYTWIPRRTSSPLNDEEAKVNL
jgi:hypothetical protein